MAEMLIAKGYRPPDPITLRLREELSGEAIVVVGPQVHAMTFDVLVILRAGVVVLHLHDWSGRIYVDEGRWRTQATDGHETALADPLAQIQAANRALAAFLADEFPALHPAVEHLILLTHPDAIAPTGRDIWPQTVQIEEIGRVVETLPEPAGRSLSSQAQTELAEALLERRLTRRQRASTPFVFRTATSLFGSRQAWTPEEVVRGLDRAPEDAVHHLRDGSLARWFEAQGAGHLARLARTAVQEMGSHPRAALEQFLIDSEMVPRPAAVIRPTEIRAGAVIAGESATAHLSITRGPGRGYLYGEVRSSRSWIRVEPEQLSEGRLYAVVYLETAGLPLQLLPHIAELEVWTNAAKTPQRIPVSLRVVPAPPAIRRNLFRPALLALAGAVPGFLLWSPVETLVQYLVPYLGAAGSEAIAAFAALSVAGLWSIGCAVAALRRRRMATLWAVVKDVVRILLPCVVGLFLVGLGAGWISRWFQGNEFPLVLMGMAGVAMAPLGPAWIGPGVPAGQSRQSRPAQSHSYTFSAWLEASLALFLILAVVAVLLRPAPLAGSLAASEAWFNGRMGMVESSVNNFVDRWMLQIYDRRAPDPTPQALDLEKSDLEILDMEAPGLETESLSSQQPEELSDPPEELNQDEP